MMATDNKRKHPNNPYPLAPKPFDLRKTSQLEQAVQKLFRLYGYESMKITHVAGRQLGAEKVTYNPITGKRQTLDKAKWIPTTGMVGSADLEGPVFLKDGSKCTLAIEIKNIYTQDRMRPNQQEFRLKHESDGGMYVVFRTITECMQWIDANLHKKINY
jgi:hypothetical protein